jgi:hypothetical protein
VQFLHEIGSMPRGSIGADGEEFRNLRIRHPVGNEMKYLKLPRG